MSEVENIWTKGTDTYKAWSALHRAARNYDKAVEVCLSSMRAMPEGEARVWAKNSIRGFLQSAICMVHGGLTHLMNMVDDPKLLAWVTQEEWAAREEQVYRSACGPGAFCYDPAEDGNCEKCDI